MSVFTIGSGSLSTVQCRNGRLFKLTGEVVITEADMFCPEENVITAQRTTIPCSGDGNKAESFEVGFWLKDGDFVKLYEVCYRIPDQSAVFTKHTLHGATLARHHRKAGPRPSYFYSESVESGVRGFYFKKNQKMPIKLLATGDASRGGQFFAKGHLSRWADGIFWSHKFATNYFVNVNPQWQNINNGNFKAVEIKAAALATQLGYDLQVITGGHGSLKFDGIEIKLDKIKVPEYIFKVIVDLHQRAGIALVVSNNPKLESVPTLCMDRCAGLNKQNRGWDFDDKTIYAKGYTICCTLRDFTAAAPYISGWFDLKTEELDNYLSFP